MKVDLDGKAPAVTPSATPQAKSGKLGGPQFSDTLKSALGPHKSTSTSAPLPPGGVGGVLPPVGLFPAEVESVDTGALVAVAETVLDRLEQLVTQLDDKRIDSKTMQPLVNELSGHKDELSSFYRGLPADHPLKDIIGGMLETVFSAIGQYHRGDFG